MSSALHRQIAEILNQKPGQVERSLDDLSRQIRRHLSGSGEVAVEGLGIFRSVKGQVEFDPDPGVLAYVNSEFDGLKDLNLEASGAYRVQEVIFNPEDAQPPATFETLEEVQVELEEVEPSAAEAEMVDNQVEGEEPEASELRPPDEEPAREEGPVLQEPPLEEPPDEDDPIGHGEDEESLTQEDLPGWATRLARLDDASALDLVPGMEDAPFDVLPSAGQDEEELAVLRALLGRITNREDENRTTPVDHVSPWDEEPGQEAPPPERDEPSPDEPASAAAEQTAAAETSEGSDPSDTDETAADAPPVPDRLRGDLPPIPRSPWPRADLVERKDHPERPPVERTSFQFATERGPRHQRSKHRRADNRIERNILWLGLVAVSLGITIFYAVIYWDAIYANLSGATRTERQANQQVVIADEAAGSETPDEEGGTSPESTATEEQTAEGRIVEPVEADEPPARPPTIVEDSPPTASRSYSQADGNYAWIVASFPSPVEAETELNRYRSAGARGEVFAADVNGRPTYRVAIGRYLSIGVARSARSELPAFAPRDAWIRNIRSN